MKLTYKLSEIDSVAAVVLPLLKNKRVLLKGALGVGKTTLVKSLVAAIGSKDTVSSPTFSVVNEYKTETTKIFHFDLYRIKDLNELLDIGFEDYMVGDHWVFIEWPDILDKFDAGKPQYIRLERKNEDERELFVC